MGKEITNETIINCHTHVFTYKTLPDNFVPLGIEKVLKYRWVTKPLVWITKHANPFKSDDLAERMGRFAKAALKENQKKVFKHLIDYYPSDSRFVVLPMDMDFCNRGTMPQNIKDQHDELLGIMQNETIGHQLLPFAHFDPRREGAVDLLEHYIDQGFVGIKLYPPLGYDPNDEKLSPIWKLANDRSLPVMVHCSRGGVYEKDLSKEKRWAWTAPENYEKILIEYPNMRLCLGHFGGDDDWEKYLGSNGKNKSWVGDIIEMLRAKNGDEYKYPNLYTDISYSVFHFETNVPALKVLLTNEAILNRTLFGSDYFMAEQEKFSEKRLSMNLRASLGEDVFWQIANINPRKYLGI